MKSLIVEDDLVARFMLKEFLEPYGPCDTVADGDEAITAVKMTLDRKMPYDLICLDIMMPNVDGQTALRRIRAIEAEGGVTEAGRAKIIIITALDDPRIAFDAYYRGGATSYIVKPLDRERIIEEIRILGLIG